MGIGLGGFFGSGGKENSGNSSTTNETNSTNLNVGGGGGAITGNLDLSSVSDNQGTINITKSDMGAVTGAFDFARDFSSNLIKSSSGSVDAAIGLASEKSRGEIENVLVTMQKYAFFAVAGFLALQAVKAYRGGK